MKLSEIIKKYAKNKDHLENTSRLSLVLFEKIKPFFMQLENYDNTNDLTLLKCGAMLHDIGINFEKAYGLPHHKAGAKYILDNKPDEINEEDVKVLACLIRYHRKALPSENHRLYKSLAGKERAKVNYLGSIIRLADAFDYLHINLIDDFKAEYYKDINVLTFFFGNNIMSDNSLIAALNRKKDFFESVYLTRVLFEGRS